MNYVQILILAIIQGAAELLPVSSSAHVIFAAKLMGLQPSSPEFVFLLVMLHTGTMFAVLVYFWPRWRWLFLPSVSVSPGARGQYFAMLALSTGITGVFGLALKNGIEKVILERWLGHDKGEVEVLFESLPLIASSLFSVGVIIIVAGFREARNEVSTISTASAFWIGLVQGICLPFRGFSRSGATISTALFRGIARPLAEDFSFALAVILTPPIIVRQILKLLSAQEKLRAVRPTYLIGEIAGALALAPEAAPMGPLARTLIAANVAENAAFAPSVAEILLPGLVGMVFSFAAGLIALKVLSAVLEKGRWQYFGYYCIAAAAVITIAAMKGI